MTISDNGLLTFYLVRCGTVLLFYPMYVLQNSIVSTDSKYSHVAWAAASRKQGGLGPDLKLPLVADRNMSISRDYGVLEDEDIALRGLDPEGVLR